MYNTIVIKDEAKLTNTQYDVTVIPFASKFLWIFGFDFDAVEQCAFANKTKGAFFPILFQADACFKIDAENEDHILNTGLCSAYGCTRIVTDEVTYYIGSFEKLVQLHREVGYGSAVRYLRELQ